ncbi:hypothetical protein SEA_APHELION_134 [Gordonia phage Aphelion]|uniref:Uncharacterized protein n=1 Tax=Gordonia phage Aphelion TaxID=2507860 RepID=A0A410TDA7_9CAUD|nr:hypothetical protein SEA_TONIANN_135 [Gordonia phage Toniann]QAU06998.1 hypothetical protein SEA_APHELION_134 [Gordonia phage Aphelion]WKW85933.1 membrane protein [Gordonia Phage PhinkBoden]WNM66404.1 membrane protein [Gordonia phage Culver]
MITNIIIIWLIGVFITLPGWTYLAKVSGPQHSRGVYVTTAVLVALVWPVVLGGLVLRTIFRILFPWSSSHIAKKVTQIAGDNSTQIQSVGDATIRIHSKAPDNLDWEREQVRQAQAQRGR